MLGKLSAKDKRELAKIQKSEELVKQYYQDSLKHRNHKDALTKVRRSLMITSRVIKKVLPEKYDYYMKCSKAIFLKNRLGNLKLMADLRYCYSFARTRLLIKPQELNPDWDKF